MGQDSPLREDHVLADNPDEQHLRVAKNGRMPGTTVMPTYPHVRSLKVRNFKGIAKLDLPIDESLTLLAGVNGVGKTSAIEALLGAVTDVWSWMAADDKEAWFRPSGDLVLYGVREGKITMELVFENDLSTTFTLPFRAKEFGNGKVFRQ